MRILLLIVVSSPREEGVDFALHHDLSGLHALGGGTLEDDEPPSRAVHLGFRNLYSHPRPLLDLGDGGASATDQQGHGGVRNDEFLRKQLPRAPPGVLQEVGNVLVDGAAVIMIVVVVVVRVERLGRMEVLPSTSGPPPRDALSEVIHVSWNVRMALLLLLSRLKELGRRGTGARVGVVVEVARGRRRGRGGGGGRVVMEEGRCGRGHRGQGAGRGRGRRRRGGGGGNEDGRGSRGLWEIDTPGRCGRRGGVAGGRGELRPITVGACWYS